MSAEFMKNSWGTSITDSTINNVGGDQHTYVYSAPPQHKPAKIILKPHSSALFTGQKNHLD
ncbi:hypothetical protein BDQ12DRAFT_694370, partial [Crucibulum laeve]